MKIQKRISVIIIILMMLVSNIAYGFNDVPEYMWYHEDINLMKDKGIIGGYGDGTFKPENNLTNSEVLTLITKIVGIDTKEPVKGDHWAKGVIEASVAKGIIESKNIDFNKNVTRLELADMLVKALDIEKIDVGLYAFKDTSSKAANILHKLGIIAGVGRHDGVYFNPENDITRAEMATILAKVDKHIENYGKGEKDKNNVPGKLKISKVLSEEEKEVVSNPSTVEDIKKVLLYMVSESKYEYKIEIKNFDKVKFTKNLEIAFNGVFSKYPEYFSFLNKMSTRLSVSRGVATITINLSHNGSFSIGEIAKMQKEFYNKSEKVIEKFIETGKITSNMNDHDKAKVIFEWVTQNTEYDLTLAEKSFNGYGQISTGKAVCQGYTSTFNLMSKMLGIKVEGITGTAGSEGKTESHIWTKAILDGKDVHIDATFGDPIPNRDGYTDYAYFATNSEFISKTHVWDVEKFGR